MKEIIYINGRFLTQKITGVQRYAIEVVKQLDKMENDKYNFIILVPNVELENAIKLQNIEIKKIGKYSGHKWEQISLPMYIKKNDKKAELLNFCNLAPVLYPGYVVIHDISFKTHREHLDWKFSLWYRFITKVNIKRYKHIFTVSEFSKKEIIENYKVKEDRITITYNSAEHLKNIEPDENIITKLELEGKSFNFSLGSKSPHKNHKYIVEYAKRNKDMLFVVSGNNNNKIFNSDEETKLDNLIYTGYLNDNELAALYKNCKSFIFPSLYEGFGIPPLEAMTLGCKNVYVSDIEVFKEIYKDMVYYLNINNPKYNEIKFNDNGNSKNRNINYKWKDVAEIMIDEITKDNERRKIN